MWNVTERFNAIGTSGEEYVVVELTDTSEPGARDDERAARKYTLEDGRELSAEKDGTFIVIDTDEVLKAVSPSAPAPT